MRHIFLDGRIEILQGDLTRQAVDGIVTPANRTLLGGAGLDAAVHRAAGPDLLEACRKLGGASPGEARITPGFRLPSRYVIHAVGPVWRDGRQGEEALLSACYQQIMELAREHEVTSLAIPPISTGAYRFPLEEATTIAIRETRDFLAGSSYPARVIFCCYSRYDLEVHGRVASSLLDPAGQGS